MKRAHIVLGITILALGILSVVPTICAAEPLQLDANGNAAAEPFAPDARVSLRLPLQTSENLTSAQSPNRLVENLTRAS